MTATLGSQRGDEEKTARPAAKRPADTVTNTPASAGVPEKRKGKVSNSWGTFTYEVTQNARSNGCNIDFKFDAFSPEIRSDKVAFIQAVESHVEGKPHYPNDDNAYYAPYDAGKRTDALKGETDPFYNYDDKSRADEAVGTTGASRTTMTDTPHLNTRNNEGQTFETAAFVMSGKDEGEFLGTITWGWQIDASGKFSLLDVAVHDEVTTTFGSALRKFIDQKNKATTTATTAAPVSLDLPANVCRELTDAEKKSLATTIAYLKKEAGARVRTARWLSTMSVAYAST